MAQAGMGCENTSCLKGSYSHVTPRSGVPMNHMTADCHTCHGSASCRIVNVFVTGPTFRRRPSATHFRASSIESCTDCIRPAEHIEGAVASAAIHGGGAWPGE